MVAVVLMMDISHIECGHAAVRRMLRGASQTHTRSLLEVSADFILMKQRIWEALNKPAATQGAHADQTHRGNTAQEKKQHRKHPGGGPQRALFSKLLRQHKGTHSIGALNRSDTFKAIHDQFAAMKRERAQ